MTLRYRRTFVLRRYRGRHRHGQDGLVHCRRLASMAAALTAHRFGWSAVRHDRASVRRRLAVPAVPVPAMSTRTPQTLAA
ncbi:MAG TPA: hypothetical protein VHI14_09615 [Jatrophihabitantaceae bacterium]|jgi:hypothetical protein|nr:hypothetical protein [Jatrophihabitantaceae bacterium]